MARKARGPAWAPGSTEYLLALIAELLDASNRAFVAANSKRKPTGQPLRVPRPGDPEPGRRMSPGEFVARRKAKGAADGKGR
jgi:hypothetical protein